MKVKQITKEIICLQFRTTKELCKTFLRFQEHYESPKFRGEIFTLGEYRDWYAKENGAFTYEDDWEGFNIPSSVLEPFIKGLFDPLTREEQKLVNMFRSRTDRFYILGIAKKGPLDHEVCHGLYYTNDGYQKAVNKVLDAYDLSELEKFLKEKGYCQEVLRDECHAYICEDADWLDDEGAEYPKELVKKLQTIKKRYFK